jgi:dipeptidyl aminopeptidase/acylaminoacyl peptidase
MPHLRFCICCAALVLLVPRACLPGHAQSAASSSQTSAARVDQILSSIGAGHMLTQVAVSPDGKRIAWILDREIHVAPIGNLSAGQRVTAATAPDQRCAEDDLAWSPDSTMLAFASDCAQPGEQSDLYLSLLDGNPPVRLTGLHGDLDAPAFAPDGKSIAFLYVENATRPAGALAAMDAPSGVIGEDHLEVQRVARVTLSSPLNCGPATSPAGSSANDNRPMSSRAGSCLAGLFSFLSPPGLHVYEFDWAPDSSSLAYIAADPPGENNWWVAKLYSQKLGAPGPDSGTWESTNSKSAGAGAPSNISAADDGGVGWEIKPSVVLAPSEVSGPLHGLQIAIPRWSPDGKSIAFIGGLMSDQGVVGGDVWAISAAGGQPHDLTPNRPTSSQWIAWGGDDQIFSEELAGGNSQLVRIGLSDGRTSESAATGFSTPVFSIAGSVVTRRYDHSLSVTADRSLFVFAASSFSLPFEIYAAGRSAPHVPEGAAGFSGLAQLSHFNDGIKPSWGPTVSVEWTNDNFHIQGWLQLPADYDPAKKYPLIVEVHGGPAAAVESHWGLSMPFSPAVFSELGYFVLEPNPRGSYGQGEAFTQANRMDFGYGDLRDILAGVDTVLAHYSVDPHRIGLDGWSYGGFMTMFAVTQTHRFRAAVAGAGISDWLSYYGENSIDQWMIPFFGASVYDDPQVYAKSSAINFIKNVTTPTLSVVGDRDGECPAPQSFEFWHALRDLRVPTQLVVYPNEGHGLADPAHRRDVLQRTLDWFARYMPPSP